MRKELELPLNGQDRFTCVNHEKWTLLLPLLKISLNIYFAFNYVNICVSVCRYMHIGAGTLGVQKSFSSRTLGAGVTGGYELPDIDAGNRL